MWWKIALLTVKDHVVMPLLQGVAFNLAWFGWKKWNEGVKFVGKGVGGGFYFLERRWGGMRC